MKITDANLEKYIELFVKPLNRWNYIVQNNSNDEKWATINKSNRTAHIGNQCEIFPLFLTDEIVIRSLQEELITGQTIGNYEGKLKTNRIIADIDCRSDYPLFFKEMEVATGKPYPDMLLQSSSSGNLQGYYFFNGYLKLTDLQAYEQYLKKILLEQGAGFNPQTKTTFPSKTAIRSPFSKDNFRLDPTTTDLTPILSHDKNASISEIHNIITQETTFSDIRQFKHVLEALRKAEQGTKINKRSRIYTNNLNSEFAKRVSKIQTTGLTQPQSRHSAVCDLSYSSFRNGLTVEEAREFVVRTLQEKNNGYSNEINKGNWENKTKTEVSGWYKRIIQHYDPTKKSKHKQYKMSLSDYRQIDKVVKSLKIGNHKRIKKAKKVIRKLYKLCKKTGINEFEINKTWWNRQGSNQNFDIRRLLLEKGLIKIIEYPQYNKDKKRCETATKYRVNFLSYLNGCN